MRSRLAQCCVRCHRQCCQQMTWHLGRTSFSQLDGTGSWRSTDLNRLLSQDAYMLNDVAKLGLHFCNHLCIGSSRNADVGTDEQGAQQMQGCFRLERQGSPSSRGGATAERETCDGADAKSEPRPISVTALRAYSSSHCQSAY